jgi:hypothetical protein
MPETDAEFLNRIETELDRAGEYRLSFEEGNTLLALARRGLGVGVKRLEWTYENAGGDYNWESWHASCRFIDYAVRQFDGRITWEWCFSEFNDEGIKECASIEEGKAKCEQHWQQTIESCLEPRALPDVPDKVRAAYERRSKGVHHHELDERRDDGTLAEWASELIESLADRKDDGA